MRATIHIYPKPGVLDPQGKAVASALAGLGFEGIAELRQGKLIELELEAPDAESARVRVEDMCERLLANTVIENYRVEIEG